MCVTFHACHAFHTSTLTSCLPSHPQDQVCLAPAPRLLLFPQLLWCCLALLRTRSTLLYTAALRLLLRLLCKLDPRQPAVQVRKMSPASRELFVSWASWP